MEDWNQKQKRHRRMLAERSVAVPVPDTLSVHLWRTELRAGALDEKAKKARRDRINGEFSAREWDEEVERMQNPKRAEEDEDVGMRMEGESPQL